MVTFVHIAKHIENELEEQSVDERRKSLREIDGTLIAKQLELPGLTISKSNRKINETGNLPLDKGSLKKSKSRAEHSANIEDATEIKELKEQLKQKSDLLVHCGKKLKVFVIQVDKLKKGIEDAKVQITKMSKNTAFAKNNRFIKFFTKYMEKMVATKVAQYKSIEAEGEGTDSDNLHQENFIREQGSKYSFEDLIAYVERIEKVENKHLSSELMIHNLNSNWNKPSGIKLKDDKNALPVTGTDEKVPAGPECMIPNNIACGEFHQRGPILQTTRRRVSTGKRTKTVRSGSKHKIKDRVSLKSRSKDARLGKRSTTPFRNLQIELQELKKKGDKKLKTQEPELNNDNDDQFLTSLTAEMPKTLVNTSDKKSAKKGRISSQVSGRMNTPERRSKK